SVGVNRVVQHPKHGRLHVKPQANDAYGVLVVDKPQNDRFLSQSKMYLMYSLQLLELAAKHVERCTYALGRIFLDPIPFDAQPPDGRRGEQLTPARFEFDRLVAPLTQQR